MPDRRSILAVAAAALLGASGPRVAAAQSSSQAASFIQATGGDLVQVVDGNLSSAQQTQAMEKIIESRVDVNGIAKFCLGRFWLMATPQQQKQYLDLFRRVLMISIDSKMGEYKGVTFTMGRTVGGDQGQVVSTVIKRPGQAPADVDWVVRNVDGAPKIVDVIADGTSLRVTQRSDYASFIVHNNDSIQALLDAMRRQVSS